MGQMGHGGGHRGGGHGGGFWLILLILAKEFSWLIPFAILFLLLYVN